MRKKDKEKREKITRKKIKLMRRGEGVGSG